MNHSGLYRALRGVLTAVLCFVLTVQAAVPAHAEETLELASEAVVLIDLETGQILYEKNADKKMYPASITKVMTGLLALSYLDPQGILTVSQSAVNAVPRSSSHISLVPGEEITVDQAMRGLAMESANDAANVLAEAVSGGLAEFAQRMNDEAKTLGAKGTNFTNANGLPDEKHYTTAYDMALIAVEAMKTPGFSDYFSTVDYQDARFTFHNKNQMLSGNYYYDGVLMAKTGWTSAAQGTFVTAVERGNRILVAVLLKSLRTEDKYIDAWKLLNYGFANFTRWEATGEQIGEQLELGNYAPAANQKFPFVVPNGTDVSKIHFEISAGAGNLKSEGSRTEVTAAATLDGEKLSDVQLLLERRITRTEKAAEAAVLSDGEDGAEEIAAKADLGQMGLGAGILAAVLLLAGWLSFRRQNSKRKRRNRLESKIRQMKKKME